MSLLHKLKKAVPRLWSQRQDHVSGREVFPDKNFTALKPKIRRQTNRLASAVAKQLCSAWHLGVLRSRDTPPYITPEYVVQGAHRPALDWKLRNATPLVSEVLTRVSPALALPIGLSLPSGDLTRTLAAELVRAHDPPHRLLEPSTRSLGFYGFVQSGYADAVLVELRGNPILVPSVWALEVANGILVGERSHRSGDS